MPRNSDYAEDSRGIWQMNWNKINDCGRNKVTSKCGPMLNKIQLKTTKKTSNTKLAQKHDAFKKLHGEPETGEIYMKSQKQRNLYG